MTPVITPHEGKSFGATITDIDLNNLTPETWFLVENAFLEYAALVFPNQFLSADAQVAFGERFGDIEFLRGKGKKSVHISNVKPDGTVVDPEEHQYKAVRGNEGWHHDSTYMPIAAKAGLLSALTIPSNGATTSLADTQAGYDALDEEMKGRISDLSAYHSLYASQAKMGFEIKTGAGYGYHDKGAPLRPLVKEHTVTGRKALCIGRHAYRIPGMDDAEAQALLDELLEITCQPSRVYVHQWTVGDLLIWDNRCVLHQAGEYDMTQPRVMQAVRIAGDPATELAETGRDEYADGFQPSMVNT